MAASHSWLCKLMVVLWAVLVIPYLANGSEFNDQNYYNILWSGPLDESKDALKDEMGKDSVVMVTSNNEKYQCLLPKIDDENDEESLEDDESLAPEKLLKDVLKGSMKRCSYRLEPYWTYELCHGQSVRQFHEEKDQEGVTKKMEFFLGKMTIAEVEKVLTPEVKPVPPPGSKGRRKVPTKRIDNRDTPYFSIEMGNGTPCDLSNDKPRVSTVLYICHSGANNELMSVKEVTTCEYEVIVLTPALCRNPAYRVKDTPINQIQCHSLEDSPSTPLSLAVANVQTQTPQINKKETLRAETPPPVDEALGQQFLNGEYCLIGGGSAWWRYEFCNGKYVNQFHEEKGKPRWVINLGNWDKAEHMKWFGQKKRAKVAKQVVHFYSGGELCDLTGKPRTAQVTLKCIKASGQQLSIYMIEPSPCNYLIGVESPILCPLIETADEYGLFKNAS